MSISERLAELGDRTIGEGGISDRVQQQRLGRTLASQSPRNSTRTATPGAETDLAHAPPRGGLTLQLPSPSGLSHLLKSYTSTHPLRSPSPLPSSSRVDPKQQQRAPPPTAASPLLWTLPTWLAFAQFAGSKGLHIIWSLIRHFLVGPRRRSWGYRMTFITSFMRNVANYTDFADIVLIRRLISITYLIPLPADAVVTPITFVVPKRRGDACRGFLREFDLQETGTRELTGEWVVGNEVWKRLKSERRAKWHAELRRRQGPGPSRLRDDVSDSGSSAAPVPLLHGHPHPPRAGHRRSQSTARSESRSNSLNGSTSNGISGLPGPSSLSGEPTPRAGSSTPEPELETDSPGRRERVIYYVHGGAYYVGNAATHRLITIGVSRACNARVFAITYRLAPEAAFPLPLLDVVQGYMRLLAPPLSIPPENLVVAGDSAGGGLSLALCMYLRDNGYPMPSGLVLLSPWVDLTMSCGSWEENGDSDVVPLPPLDSHLNPVGCYLGPEGIGAYVTHPYASPLFGDLSKLPPMLIQSGDSEVLRDEITLLAHKATLSGVHVTHELYEDMVHVFQMFTWLPATHASINSIGRWVRQTLPRIEWEARQANLDDVAEEPLSAELPTEADDRPGRSPAWGGAGAPWTRTAEPENLNPYDAEEDPFLQAFSDEGISLPRLRRAHTTAPVGGALGLAGLGTGPQSAHPHPYPHSTHAISRPRSRAASPTTLRRRRQTASMHMSSPVSPAEYVPSPTPSRRRLRAPSSSHPTTPSTRARNHSHTDIFDLVEGYMEGGAANATVVYAPGGEIRSVGVLGDESEEN